MKVRDLMEVVVNEKDIFIKPSGRPVYYEGTIGNTPCVLLDATIREISPRGYYNEDIAETQRITTSIGIWVDNIEELDALYYALDFYDMYNSKEIDTMYCYVMKDREKMMDRLKKIAEYKCSITEKGRIPTELEIKTRALDEPYVLENLQLRDDEKTMMR